MPYEINWESSGVYLHYSGEVTAQDIELASKEVATDPRMPTIGYVLCDFLEAREVAISYYEALLTAAKNHAVADVLAPQPRVALVTDNEGAMKLALTYAESPLMANHARVFPCLADARKWVLETP